MKHLATLALCLAATTPAVAESIEDLTTWSLVEDPPDPNASGTIDSPSQVTLTMVDAVPRFTDIGFASVNGETVADSTSGFFFSSDEDFSIAVDYAFDFPPTESDAAFGFGIGEDRQGANSAGVVMFTRGGEFTPVLAAGRVDDRDSSRGQFPGGATESGRFFVSYDALTQGISVGLSATPSVNAADETILIDDLATEWSDSPLLVSFFLRSAGTRTSGQVAAEFSNFEVLSGTPIRVPEPATVALAALAAATGLRRR